MNATSNDFDVVVIGSGPAGQSAALEAARLGARVLVVEREAEFGGACVQYGTIPSKTLRETAFTLTAFNRRSGGVYNISKNQDLQLNSLMTRLHQVVDSHHRTSDRYLEVAGIEKAHGQAMFLSDRKLRIQDNHGGYKDVSSRKIIIATGSRPRSPAHLNVDHENILDSDSILSMSYLPKSLAIYGGGVIACEYAATFACLGVRVLMFDRYPAPLGFLDSELVTEFLRQFHESGGKFIGNCRVESAVWDGVSKVATTIKDSESHNTEKAFVAQGRVANAEHLNIESFGAGLTERGLIPVNNFYQTVCPSIYAVGDVIGPPSLASTSTQQGQFAARHALEQEVQKDGFPTPIGIYTIPEMAAVGMAEDEAKQQYEQILVGHADLKHLARGEIMATKGGVLKLISDQFGERILGVHIVGDGATELIHIGQMAMRASMSIDQLAATIFNFPTLAEAYRVASTEIISQRDGTLVFRPETEHGQRTCFPTAQDVTAAQSTGIVSV